MTKNFTKIVQNLSITLLALAAELIISLKSGDIVYSKLAASGYRDRDFLGYIGFFVRKHRGQVPVKYAPHLTG